MPHYSINTRESSIITLIVIFLALFGLMVGAILFVGVPVPAPSPEDCARLERMANVTTAQFTPYERGQFRACLNRGMVGRPKRRL